MVETTMIGPLPDYKSPPVVETVLGVQFDRLPAFKNAHFGAFWKSLDINEWPTLEDAPALPKQFERFTQGARWKALQFQISQDVSCRVQIRNKDNDRMIQVQNGRLHFNWLGEGGGEYPRFENVSEGFDSALRQLIAFIGNERLGEFRPNQWEMTYVNHIPKGTVWNSPDDWSFFRLLGQIPISGDFLRGESFAGEWQFEIPEQRGRLHITWQHAKNADRERQEDEFVRLEFTARGEVKQNGSDDLQAVSDGLSLGRTTIVQSFKSFMSEEANSYWGLK